MLHFEFLARQYRWNDRRFRIDAHIPISKELGETGYRAMKYRYDKDVDALYGAVAYTVEAHYECVAPGLYLRRNAGTGELVGFIVLNFMHRRHKGALPRIPELEAAGVP